MRKSLAVACLVASSVLALALAAAASGDTKAPKELRAGTLTPEMVVSMHEVREMEIAPEGDLIAYTVRVPRDLDEERGKPYSEIWLVDRDGNERRRFTAPGQRAWAPRFAPDGKSLAFLSDRGRNEGDKTNDIFLIELTGGEARLLTDGEYSIADFRWSPTGETIAFMAKEPRSEDEKKQRKRGRDWIVGDRELRPQHLWVVEVDGAAVRRLTESNVHVWTFDWAPDGQAFLLQISDSARADEWYLWTRLALLPATGGEPAALVRTQGKLQRPRFSPDGRHVAWLGALDLHDPYAGTVFVAPVSGGPARVVNQDEPGTATWLEWTDATTLLYAATRGTETVLARASLSGKTPQDMLVNGPEFTRFVVSADRKSVALIGSTPVHSSEVFAGKLAKRSADVKRITVTSPQIERTQLGAQEVVRWTAEDGLEIEGLVIRPPDFTPGTRYPLVVQVHGGPESCYRNGWNTRTTRWTQLLAQRGFVVLAPNYRGSIGRGEDFERGDHKDLAGREFTDVLAGIDALVKRGWVDPERVGIGGGSYGGYFSAWASTAWSERFAAAVVFAGITNWHSMQGVSDIPQENAYVHWNLPYYDNFDLYWERSPIAHVKRCRTPVLIGHGDKDARVPVGQGIELYTALRLLGKEVELVRYPRAGHGLSEVHQQLDFITRSLAWFERHLKRSTQAVYR